VGVSTQLDSLRAFVSSRPTLVPNASTGPRNVIVVGSGKGGSGTSVVAALIALSAAAAGRRVLLVDADEHVGPQRYLLGIGVGPTLADLRGTADAASIAVPISATLSVIRGGPPASGASMQEPAERRAALRRAASLYAGHDLVVIDGGSRLDTVCACCEATGAGGLARLVVVSGIEPIALAASYALVKAARERTSAMTGTAVAADVVVNRHDDEAAEHAFAQVADACRFFLDAPLRLVGSLPNDPSLEVALRAGMSLQDAAAGSPAAVATQTLTERLLADLGAPNGAPRLALPSRRAANPYASSLATPAGATR
jgi:flagellar biosynthesis protein FlhG